jgi:hypothetical protein
VRSVVLRVTCIERRYPAPRVPNVQSHTNTSAPPPAGSRRARAFFDVYPLDREQREGQGDTAAR